MIPIIWSHPVVAAGIHLAIPLAIKGLSRFLNR